MHEITQYEFSVVFRGVLFRGGSQSDPGEQFPPKGGAIWGSFLVDVAAFVHPWTRKCVL